MSAQAAKAFDDDAGAGLSVCLVTYNSQDTVDAALRSVSDRLPGAEVILVDNGSSDGTIAIARKAGIRRLLHGHGNVGYGTAVNMGIRAATHEIVLVINPDIVIESVYHANLATMQRIRPFGLVSCTSRWHGRLDTPVRVGWRGRRELASALFTWFLKPRSFNVERRAPRRRESGWVGGYAFLLARAEWELTGGFDEAIFLYYEDFDLSRRYLAAGLPMRATDAIEVEHVRHAATRGTQLELVQSWALRSLVQTTATWEGDWAAITLASTALRALVAIERLAKVMSRLPLLGSKAKRTGHSVRVVHDYLVEARPPTTDAAHYAAADRAFRRANQC